VLLLEPDEDFSGGEFVLTDSDHVCKIAPLRRGDAVVCAVHNLPAQGIK
jgi:uncharacterized protein